MRECGCECSCRGKNCRISPVSYGLTFRLMVKSSGAKGLGQLPIRLF
jgi:hypothetical protein